MLIATGPCMTKPNTPSVASVVFPDGRAWGEKHLIGDPDFWLWRVTWHKGKAYGIGYWVQGNHTRLYTSSDGRSSNRLSSGCWTRAIPMKPRSLSRETLPTAFSDVK
jgi:hypothetical protein